MESLRLARRHPTAIDHEIVGIRRVDDFERPNHVWAYDFVETCTHDGRKYRMLRLPDEFTRECLAIKVARWFNSMDVIEIFADLRLERGVPGFIRSD